MGLEKNLYIDKYRLRKVCYENIIFFFILFLYLFKNKIYLSGPFRLILTMAHCKNV